jgi:hypothetical protein
MRFTAATRAPAAAFSTAISISWKVALAVSMSSLTAAATAQTGQAITVCHLTPDTSKWNKIEHRLFSHISMNWRGRPLTSHEVIVQSIAATTTATATATGLTVHADLATYPIGVKIPDTQTKALYDTGILHRHDWQPEWNYTLNPPQNCAC